MMTGSPNVGVRCKSRPRVGFPAMSEQGCPECGAADFIRIDLTVADDTEVTFCSCHRCENRWWDKGGKALPLNAVLKLARKSK